jgi:hypothetical protein
MALDVTSGRGKTVTEVKVNGKTRVHSVKVGRPVKNVQSSAPNVNNIVGISTASKEDGDILIYNAISDTFESSPLATANINTIAGVDTSTKQDGSVLVYNATSENFEATKNLDKQFINGGNF